MSNWHAEKLRRRRSQRRQNDRAKKKNTTSEEYNEWRKGRSWKSGEELNKTQSSIKRNRKDDVRVQEKSNSSATASATVLSADSADAEWTRLGSQGENAEYFRSNEERQWSEENENEYGIDKFTSVELWSTIQNQILDSIPLYELINVEKEMCEGIQLDKLPDSEKKPSNTVVTAELKQNRKPEKPLSSTQKKDSFDEELDALLAL
eukprot:g3281.t1